MSRELLANLIFPDIKETIEDLERRYPERNIDENSEVTRFAPSPTGFLHTGSLFTSMIAYRFAKQTNGIFYFRLEDTDTKREVEGSEKELLSQLKEFNIVGDEGVTLDGEIGKYGPYAQSKRADIYKIVIKQMIKDNLAYPCFCSKEDLDDLRAKQEAEKIIPGYYGIYARDKNLPVEEYIKRINEGKPYVIRFNSSGDHNNKIHIHDEIRDDLYLAENDQDIVILKSDGLPTYHFAHAVDDHFMRTTLVTRGEEWLSSLPIHLDLFDSLGFKRVKYAHLPVIMKMDENGSRRKLSKRKDKEAAVSNLLEQGYPIQAILTYLTSIANSNFEEAMISNRNTTYANFDLTFSKMSLDGALFDIEKLRYFSKEFLGNMNKNDFYNLSLEYANKYDSKLLHLINIDKEKYISIINIEREKDNPRKDYSSFDEIYQGICYMYDEVYDEALENLEEDITLEKHKNFIKDCLDNLDFTDNDEQAWFAQMKGIAASNGYGVNNKEYKANPELFIGNMASAASSLRFAVTLRVNTPNLYCILNILGKKEVKRRINLFLSKI